jgi:hypothetical protein
MALTKEASTEEQGADVERKREEKVRREKSAASNTRREDEKGGRALEMWGRRRAGRERRAERKTSEGTRMKGRLPEEKAE